MPAAAGTCHAALQAQEPACMPSGGACPAAQPRHPGPVPTPFLSAPVEQDKALRQLVFRHVTADIKNSNKRGRNERLNRAVQNFMYRCG